MKREDFAEFVRDRIVILDGATGSALINAGMPGDVCADLWAVEHPEALKELQKAYVEAGSEIIYTPTFSANRIRLKQLGLADKVEYINREGVALSKAVCGEALVAGDVSMTGEMLKPYGSLEYEELVDVYKEQMCILEEAGCDLLTVETIMDLEEAKAAVTAAMEATSLPVMAALTFTENGRTMSGAAPEDAAKTLADLGAGAVGANCSAGPEQMFPLVEAMVNAVDIPIIAKPNAGKPLPSLGKGIKYGIDPDSYAIMITRLVDAGANIVGGCCGTNPDYIRQIALLCGNMTFKSK